MSGVQHEASHDHYLKVNRASTLHLPSSLSKQSHSVAGDGLRAMPYDQSLNPHTDQNEDNDSFVASNSQSELREVSISESSQGLRVVCDYHNSEVPLPRIIGSQIEAKEDELLLQPDRFLHR